MAGLGLCCCTGFSLVVVSRGYSTCGGFSSWGRLLLQSTGSRRMGFTSCSTWAQLPGSRVQAQKSWHTGLVAPQTADSVEIEQRLNCVSHLGMMDSLPLSATREALYHFYYQKKAKDTLGFSHSGVQFRSGGLGAVG